MPRDGSGLYTLPPGNPVVAGTIIDVAWANPTMSDIAVQLNNVITRNGLLGPTAPISFVAGTAANPGLNFAASPSTGLYSPLAAVVAMSAAGAAVQQWQIDQTIFFKPPVYAADPVGGNELTRKSYVDNFVTSGFLPLTGGSLVGPGNLSIGGTLAANGGVTLGDAAADALTINSGTATIPNGLNFNGGNVAIGAPIEAEARLLVASTPAPTGATQAIVRNFESGCAMALTVTGTAFAYAGVLANESWLYVAGSRNLVLGPDGAGAIKFVMSGAERGRLDTVGLGIGGLPTAPMQAFGSNANSYSALFAVAAGVGPVGNGSRLAMVNAGPQSQLRSNWYYNGADRAAEAGYSPYMVFSTTDGSTQFFRTNTVAAGNPIAGPTLSVYFDNVGKVGIGRIPGYTLDIQAPGQAVIRLRGGSGTTEGAAYYVANGGSDATFAAFGDASAIVGGAPNTTAMLWAGAVPLSVSVGGAERIRVLTAGVTQLIGNFSTSRTWQNFTGSRAYNTVYAAPIYDMQLSVSATTTGASQNIALYINGTLIAIDGNGASAPIIDVGLHGHTIPAGSTYEVRQIGGFPTVGAWFELR